jgi:HEPN domain-containing protein
MRPDTAAWVAKSDDDYASSLWEMKRPPTPNFDAACFHAQQSVEKLMKAFLTERGAVYPKTHSLADLSLLIVALTPTWTFDPNDFGLLQPGAVEFRYPGASATPQDASDAIAACTRLRQSLRPLV